MTSSGVDGSQSEASTTKSSGWDEALRSIIGVPRHRRPSPTFSYVTTMLAGVEPSGRSAKLSVAGVTARIGWAPTALPQLGAGGGVVLHISISGAGISAGDISVNCTSVLVTESIIRQ